MQLLGQELLTPPPGTIVMLALVGVKNPEMTVGVAHLPRVEQG